MKEKNKIYKILCVVLILVVLPVLIFLATRESGNHEENKRNNLELIKKHIDFEKLETIEINDKNSIDGCNSFIIVRNRNDVWTIDRAYGGKEFYGKWTEADLNEYGLIVFALSTYESAQYENSAGETQYLTSESVDLYYYNILEDSIFKRERIEGKKLEETEQNNHEISSNELFDKIKKEFVK